jgi:hypothetical protein
MSGSEEIFIISVPAAVTQRVEPLLPSGFAPARAAESGPEFRFGISDFHEYVGVAKDVASFVTALLGLLAAVRAAGGKSIGIRRPTAAAPDEIGVEANESDVRSKLKLRRDS